MDDDDLFIEPKGCNNVPFKPDFLYSDLWSFWYEPVVNKEIFISKIEEKK